MMRRKLLPVNTIRRSSFHAFPDAYRDATKGIDYGDSAALAFRVSFLASDQTSVKSRETWKKVRHLADILAGVPKNAEHSRTECGSGIAEEVQSHTEL